MGFCAFEGRAASGVGGGGLLFAAWLCCLSMLAFEARGQEAINTTAVTEPGEGIVVYQTRVRAVRFEGDPTGARRAGTELRFEHRLQYGVSGRDSLQADWSYVWREYHSGEGSPGVGDTDGAGDLRLSYKRRVWERDIGPVDTLRLSVFGGAELPVGGRDFTSASVDPFLGATFLAILGRHGFNQSVSWEFTTGATESRLFAGDSLSDVLRFDSAYLYRLAPAAYGEEYAGSWYALVELNGVVETNGDTEGLVSPGVLYEGTTWAAELGVQVPLWSDVDERPSVGWALSGGLRFLF